MSKVRPAETKFFVRSKQKERKQNERRLRNTEKKTKDSLMAVQIFMHISQNYLDKADLYVEKPLKSETLFLHSFR
jgi:hypothetical protein